MHPWNPFVSTLLALTLPAATGLAQEGPRFGGSLGWAGGSFRLDSDLAGFDDRADAALVQLELEAVSARGFGGGLRLERFRSDGSAGLFRDRLDPLDPGIQARNGALQAHFTYLVREHRFEMPVRAGLAVGDLVLDDPLAAAQETRYASLGPFFEVEPELELGRRGAVRWSVFGQLGVGFAGVDVDVDGDPRDYSAGAASLHLELGARVRLGPAELGVAYVGRYLSIEESSVEDGQFVYGFDAGFQGVLLTAGVRF